MEKRTNVVRVGGAAFGCAVALVAVLSGCSDPSKGRIEMSRAPSAETAATSNAAAETSEERTVEVLGLLRGQSHEGKDAVGVVCRYVNGEDVPMAMGDETSVVAWQDGESLDSAWVEAALPEGWGTPVDRVSNGGSVTCVQWFEIRSDADVRCTLTHWPTGTDEGERTIALSDAVAVEDAASASWASDAS